MTSPENLRKYFGLTMEDVAKAAGVTRQVVIRYEKGLYKKSKLNDYYNGEMFEKIRNEKYGNMVYNDTDSSYFVKEK